MSDNQGSSPVSKHTLFIVSGGYGMSGEQIARTAMAQFAEARIELVVVPHIKTVDQVYETVEKAAARQATILHTLVNQEVRSSLVQAARKENVHTIDLIGVLLGRLSAVLGTDPIGQPGLYRQLREEYFNRVEAIEFAVAHDDGKRVEELRNAEIVLIGPSRVGKTPLSMYLSVQGWKVANIPLIKEFQLPTEIFRITKSRIIGLKIDPGQLIFHRKRRQARLGLTGQSDYSDPQAIADEIKAARAVYRRAGFPVVDVTDRPIEETAEEIIGIIKRRNR